MSLRKKKKKAIIQTDSSVLLEVIAGLIPALSPEFDRFFLKIYHQCQVTTISGEQSCEFDRYLS